MGTAAGEKFIERLKAMLEKPDSAPLTLDNLGRLKYQILYTDIRLDLVKHLTELLKRRASTKTPCTEGWMKNILKVVGCIAGRDNFDVQKFANEDDPAAALNVAENYLEFRKRFSELWSEVMKWKKGPSVYKLVLVLLPDRIMVHLTKPLYMSHFLMESFKMGGSAGLVSLHGIYLLMKQYNFDVPDFYTKLYSMFTTDVLHSKFRSRFFAYAGEFLSSTHLPEYLVAAFAKRLSRLSLYAPAPVIPMICDFILNLMIDHPGLKTLVNKKSSNNKNEEGQMTVDDDPYDENEIDPLLTRAMESSLWEMKTLQHHVLPTVALTARFIAKGLPKVSKDMGDTLDRTYDDIYKQETAASHSIEPFPNHVVPRDFGFAFES